MSKPTPELKSEWLMRINKYLAHEGISTRRGADDLVENGKETINGAVALLADKVFEVDQVEINGSITPKKYVYFAYNKPLGVITHSPQLGEDDIKQNVIQGLP